VAVGVLLLVLAVRNVDPSGLMRSLSGTNIWLVVLGLATVACTIVVKAWRWRLLLPASPGNAGLATLISALLVGQATNLLLPARLGEVARAYLVAKDEERPVFEVLGTIVVEKVLDGLALGVLLVYLLVAMPMPDWLRMSGALAGVTTVFILAAALVLTIHRRRVLDVSDGLVRLLPVLERLGLERRIASLADGLDALRSSQVRVRVVIWTAIIWLLAASTNYVVLLAMQIQTPLVLASFLVLTVVHLGLVVPTSPARVGVFHYLCLLALVLVGVEESLALAYGFVLHAIVVLPVILVGMLCLWRQNLSLYRLLAEVEVR
jgi:uncharacterized protein (TIRG00374 family)